ncbi:MAG TPA: glycosyltransferase family 2 protein, partial [Mariniphaga sp.]|nr:glycosyltransferase family 2 protein [Mariniphaga sp.]
MKKVDCFIANTSQIQTKELVSRLNSVANVNQVYVVSPESVEVEGAGVIVSEHPYSVRLIHDIAGKAVSEFVLLGLDNIVFEPGRFAIDRLIQVADATGAAMVYGGYRELKSNVESVNLNIEYQSGSLRDDFNFGPIQLFHTNVLKSFTSENFTHAGLYALRLNASRMGKIVHIPEILSTMTETDMRKSGEKQFDYVRSAAREKQIEMEQVCLHHLKAVGAYLSPPFKQIDPAEHTFPVEASVVIPVKNRVRTIRDAVESVLKQKTSFRFNLIVIDNYSEDGTTQLLEKYARDGKLIHIIPKENGLGIGGCWNEGIFNENCGRFAVQLDSDDLYAGENTLQLIINKFYEDRCAMVIGSYRMTNFDLEEIPPGIIDHKEWTDDNGPNNALRINGLGAPRAFYT